MIFCEFNTRPHAIFLPRVIGPYIQLHVKDPFNGLTQERKWSGDTADVLIRTSVHLWAVWLRRCYWEAVVCHSCLHMQLWICVFVSEVCMRTWVCMCVCVWMNKSKWPGQHLHAVWTVDERLRRATWNGKFHISPSPPLEKSMVESLAEFQMRGESMSSPALCIGTTWQP